MNDFSMRKVRKRFIVNRARGGGRLGRDVRLRLLRYRRLLI